MATENLSPAPPARKNTALPLSVRLSADINRLRPGPTLFEWHVNETDLERENDGLHLYGKWQAQGEAHRERLPGQASTATEEVWVGNSKPQLEIKVKGNRSFYWDNEELPYQVVIEDKEDGS